MIEQTPTTIGAFVGTAANDNFTASELPTSIPPGKARASAELVLLTHGHPVRRVGKKDVSLASLVTRREKILQDARTPSVPNVSPIFSGAPPANDNREPQSWPLAEALRRAGREADLEVCEMYRGLWSVMAADPLQGRDPNMADDEEEEVHTESRSTINGKDAFDKFGIVTGTGEIQYKGVRQLARTPGTSRKATHKGDAATGGRYAVTTARFSESTLIAQIDMRGAWGRLRAAIRTLLAAFEAACLDGATLTEIGEARGFKDRQASAAGKALVFEAIGALSEEWNDIRREARELEAAADRNVIRYRARLERATDAYLGKVA